MELSNSPPSKQVILSTFFDYDITRQQAQGHKFEDSYFNYYHHSLKSSGLDSSSQKEILDLVKLLKCPETTRALLETHLEKEFSSDDSGESHDLLNLAVRLLLMIPIGPFIFPGRGITVSGETYLPWTDGTITDFVNTHFSPQITIKERVRLEKGFNARNVKRIARIKIKWTCNLADHLRMREDDTVVEIFHNVSFLRFHQSW
jgi:hypothetical protein